MARPRSARRRISQADVAKRAGVSAGIVSSVINDKTYGSIRVSDATKQRVLAAVQELGYVPDLAARTMAGGSNRIIGVFTYEAVFPSGASNFYHEFLVGIEEAADEAEYNLLLLTGAKQAQRRSLYGSGVNGLRLADGGLLVGSNEDPDEVRRLAREHYPFVFVGERRFADLEASFVAADYLGGTAEVVQQLYRLGHRRIGLARTHQDPVPGRTAGFAQGCADVGIEPLEFPLALASTEPAAVAEWLDRLAEAQVTAVVLQGSRGEILTQIQEICRERGIALGSDLSVVDLHGVRPRSSDRDWSELVIPRHGMGREAVSLLLRLIEDPDGGPLRSSLSCHFSAGDTVGPPATR